MVDVFEITYPEEGGMQIQQTLLLCGRKRTPFSDRLLRESFFIRADGLWDGHTIIGATPIAYGKWGEDGTYVFATTTEGEVWLAVKPGAPDLLKQMKECLAQVCPGGRGGPVFDGDHIPMRDILRRNSDPEYDPHPRH